MRNTHCYSIMHPSHEFALMIWYYLPGSGDKPGCSECYWIIPGTWHTS